MAAEGRRRRRRRRRRPRARVQVWVAAILPLSFPSLLPLPSLSPSQTRSPPDLALPLPPSPTLQTPEPRVRDIPEATTRSRNLARIRAFPKPRKISEPHINCIFSSIISGVHPPPTWSQWMGDPVGGCTPLMEADFENKSRASRASGMARIRAKFPEAWFRRLTSAPSLFRGSGVCSVRLVRLVRHLVGRVDPGRHLGRLEGHP